MAPRPGTVSRFENVSGVITVYNGPDGTRSLSWRACCVRRLLLRAQGSEDQVDKYRVETVIAKNGTLELKDLPFRAGEVVDVIVLSRRAGRPASRSRPLRGLPVEYVDPLESVAESDWEACG